MGSAGEQSTSTWSRHRLRHIIRNFTSAVEVGLDVLTPEGGTPGVTIPSCVSKAASTLPAAAAPVITGAHNDDGNGEGAASAGGHDVGSGPFASLQACAQTLRGSGHTVKWNVVCLISRRDTYAMRWAIR